MGQNKNRRGRGFKIEGVWEARGGNEKLSINGSRSFKGKWNKVGRGLGKGVNEGYGKNFKGL